jgi:peptide-methionine (R)-S-oxide reductase
VVTTTTPPASSAVADSSASAANGPLGRQELSSPEDGPSPGAALRSAAAGNDELSSAENSEMVEKMDLTDEEWKERLTPEQYRVLREKGTERPFVNKYDEHFEPGVYACAACGQELFSSQTKFNSGCGWPAFYAAKAGDRVILSPDLSHGMVRTEVTCARCDSHLGHVFEDAPQTPSGQRYCINSVALKFIPAEDQEGEADDQ